VGNSFGIFQPNSVAGFQISFAYWTDVTSDGLPEMVNSQGIRSWQIMARSGHSLTTR
jgi:hypothetical protein